MTPVPTITRLIFFLAVRAVHFVQTWKILGDVWKRGKSCGKPNNKTSPSHHHRIPYIVWLVVFRYHPSEKWWTTRQLGWWNSIPNIFMVVISKLGWLFHSQLIWKIIQPCSSPHQLDPPHGYHAAHGFLHLRNRDRRTVTSCFPPLIWHDNACPVCDPVVKYIVKYMGYTKYIESQGYSWDTENIHQDSVNPCWNRQG